MKKHVVCLLGAEGLGLFVVEVSAFSAEAESLLQHANYPSDDPLMRIVADHHAAPCN